jgi:hypothetical protein
MLAQLGARLRGISPSMAVALLALVIAVGGVAVASIPGPDGVIQGCYDNSTGALSVIDPAAGRGCPPGATALSWNQTGPQGPQGPPGDPAPVPKQNFGSDGKVEAADLPNNFRSKPRKPSPSKLKQLTRLGSNGEPTEAFHAFRNAAFEVPTKDDLFPTVARVDVPAGKYMAIATSTLLANETSALGAGNAFCTLIVGTGSDERLFEGDPVLLTAVGNLKQPGRIEFRCVGEEIPAFGLNLNLMEKARITAVKLAKFTSKPTNGGP